MIIRLLQWLCTFAILIALPLGAEVNASLDKGTVSLGSTVHLTLTMDDAKLADQIDISALDKDFSLVGRNVRSFISMQNGDVSTQTHLELMLQPRYSGEFIIPAIAIGTEQTDALKLNVIEQSSSSVLQADGTPPVIIEARWENTGKPYVQSQINMVVRIFHTGSLPGAALEDPRPVDTLIERLGADEQGVEVKNGIRYQTLERRFALFPQKSGSLTVPPIVMQMRAPVPQDPALRSFGFDVFRRQMISLNTEPLTIDVLPHAPQSTAANWIPAENLTLEQSGLPGDEIEHGEAINLNISVAAMGLTAAQLPEVKLTDANGQFNIYPDQPTLANTSDGRVISGKRDQTFVLIPTESGSLEIPEIKVTWWDRINDRQQVASLPPSSIRVAVQPDEGEDALPAPMQSENTVVSEPLSDRASAGRPSSDYTYWKWLSLVSLCGWLLSVVYLVFIRPPGRTRKRVNRPDHRQAILLQLLKRIRKSARANQADETWQAMQAFGRACWPQNPPQTPEHWARQLSSQPAGRILADLDASLYRTPQTKNWSGKKIDTELVPILNKLCVVAPSLLKQPVFPAMYSTAK